VKEFFEIPLPSLTLVIYCKVLNQWFITGSLYVYDVTALYGLC